MKKIIVIFIILWTFMIGYGVYDIVSHNPLQFCGRIVDVSEDKYTATRADIGRSVIIFLDDPRTPTEVKDDSFTAFWVF